MIFNSFDDYYYSKMCKMWPFFTGGIYLNYNYNVKICKQIQLSS